MSDIGTVHDGCRFDWIVSGVQFGASASLYENVVNSIFCDRRAEPSDEIPDGSDNPRGWWADTSSEEGKIGSRLWTLRREKATAETRRRAIGFIREALVWLIEDDIAESVEIDAVYSSAGHLEITVAIHRKGEEPQRFDFLWGGQ